jgi:uncharacterized protein DUF4249
MKANIFKTIKGSLLIVIISTLVLFSCVEEYWPELDGDYETILVVDGKITNAPGPYTVKISTSSSLDSIPYGREPEYDFKGLRGALVTIHDNDGNLELLTEIDPGIYQTDEGGMQGVIGKSYKITISTPDGKSYESTFEELLQPTGIQDVGYTEEQDQYIINNEEIVDLGIRFNVTSMEAPENLGNFYWELEETYEYHSAYKIEYVYNGILAADFPRDAPWGLSKVKNPDSLFYCWQTKIVREVFTKSTNQFAVRKVENLPLNFISYDNEKMDYKYSVLVNQYTVSNGAHNFLKKINDQNRAQEGLYASQPYQIIGNITNVEDLNEPVLGYFMTASKAESKRVTYTAPFKLEVDTFRICKILAWDFVGYSEASVSRVFREIHYYTEVYELPVYLTHAWVCTNCPAAPGFRVYAIRFAAVGDGCVDCRERQLGGYIEKPDYWDD